jgi:alkylated DNA repair dioxygenase AlkB
MAFSVSAVSSRSAGAMTTHRVPCVTPILFPAFLLALRTDVAAFAGVSGDSLQQILINEYAPRAGIGWHRDRPVFSDVIAVSLSAPATPRLRRRQGNEWERASRTLQPRSAYLLRGSRTVGVAA